MIIHPERIETTSGKISARRVASIGMRPDRSRPCDAALSAGSSPALRCGSAVNHVPDTHRSLEPTEMTECRSYRADADRADPFEPHATAAAIPHRFSSWAASDIRKELRVLPPPCV